MPELQSITVELGGRTGTLPLSIGEFQPYDPAAYQHDAGWLAHDTTYAEGADVPEYFISYHTGEVFLAGYYELDGEYRTHSKRVGIAPDVLEAAEKIERMMTSAYHSDTRRGEV